MRQQGMIESGRARGLYSRAGRARALERVPGAGRRARSAREQ